MAKDQNNAKIKTVAREKRSEKELVCVSGRPPHDDKRGQGRPTSREKTKREKRERERNRKTKRICTSSTRWGERRLARRMRRKIGWENESGLPEQ